MPVVVYTVPPDDENKCLKHVEAINLNKLKANMHLVGLFIPTPYSNMYCILTNKSNFSYTVLDASVTGSR
jgi:hypothetical protein